MCSQARKQRHIIAPAHYSTKDSFKTNGGGPPRGYSHPHPEGSGVWGTDVLGSDCRLWGEKIQILGSKFWGKNFGALRQKQAINGQNPASASAGDPQGHSVARRGFAADTAPTPRGSEVKKNTCLARIAHSHTTRNRHRPSAKSVKSLTDFTCQVRNLRNQPRLAQGRVFSVTAWDECKTNSQAKKMVLMQIPKARRP